MPILLKLGLLVVVAIIGVILTLDLRPLQQNKPPKVRWWGLILSAILLFITFGVEASVGQVGASERGLVLRFGAATERVLQPGLYFVTPFVEQVQLMDV